MISRLINIEEKKPAANKMCGIDDEEQHELSFMHIEGAKELTWQHVRYIVYTLGGDYQMKINAVQFRSNCFKILDEVRQTHKEVIITKRGKPVAKLVHINQDDAQDPLLGAMEGIGCTIDDLTKPVTAHTEWEID